MPTVVRGKAPVLVTAVTCEGPCGAPALIANLGGTAPLDIREITVHEQSVVGDHAATLRHARDSSPVTGLLGIAAGRSPLAQEPPEERARALVLRVRDDLLGRPDLHE